VCQLKHKREIEQDCLSDIECQIDAICQEDSNNKHVCTSNKNMLIYNRGSDKLQFLSE